MEWYKESGIDWIGKIPIEWDIKKIKYVYKLQTGFTPDTSKPEYYDNENGYTWISIADMNDKFIYDSKSKISELYIKEKHPNIIKKNNLLYSFKLSVGKIGFNIKDVYTNEAIASFETNNDVCLNYLYYAAYLIEFNANTNIYGAKILNQNLINNALIINPPIQEQKQIADFLDKKVDKIDKILEDLNKQIEILNNYKKSIITEAVTKGLDINVEYKNSGIDWIGNIPKKWQIKRLKYLGTSRNGLTYSPENIVDEDNGILVLRSSNIQSGKLDYHDNVYVNCKVPVNLLLKKNDLLICSRNGSRNLIGKNALIDNSSIGNTFGAFMCVFRGEYNKYIYYIMNSYLFDNYLNSFLTSTINQLTNSNLGNIKVPFTYDIIEQQKIISYLDDKCSNIDKTIQIKKNQIDKLENYKKSLIYEYVTGKKRVKEE